MNTGNVLTGVPQVNFKRPLNGDNHINMLSTLLIQKNVNLFFAYSKGKNIK